MANGNTLFITAEYMKAKTHIDDNVDEKYLKVAIADAQQLYLKGIIGTGLYNELESQTDAGTLTALNTTLIQFYIAPCLKFYTMVEVMPFMLYKFTNKNISTKSSENSQSVSWSDMNKVMEETTNKAQAMADRLRKYLLENQSSYPLYSNPGSGIDTIHPTNDVFESGIFLGNTHNKNASFGHKMDNLGTYGCEEDWE